MWRRVLGVRVFGAGVFGGVLLLSATPAVAQTELQGQTPGGAHYVLLVPDGWVPEQGLVIYNHGYEIQTTPTVPPAPGIVPELVTLQQMQGYAIAASSYRVSRWSIFSVLDDIRQMVQVFESEFGVPESILVYGDSMGGLVTARTIEEGNVGNVIGALTFCGIMGPGSRWWDRFFDERLIYDVLCSEVPGAAIPGGAWGLPVPPDPNFNPTLADPTLLVEAADACFGVTLPAAQRTPGQQQRLDRFQALTGVPQERSQDTFWVQSHIGFATLFLRDILTQPGQLDGRQGMDNFYVDYGDAEVNGRIERVRAEPEARRRLVENYTPTGRIGAIKNVSLHTDKDPLVAVENEHSYSAIVPPTQRTVAVVAEDEPTHCGFTIAEIIAGWETLRAWVEGGPQPSAATVDATCEAVVAAGVAPGPCRIDPNYVIPPLDEVERPRLTCTPDATTLCLHDGRFQVTMEWVDFTAGAGLGQAVPQTGSAGSFWFFNAENLELTVKVLDGRRLNSHFWVFFGALTNLGFTLTVTDTVSAVTKVYENTPGTFTSVGDTQAF